MLAELWNKNKFYIQGTNDTALSLFYLGLPSTLPCFLPLYLKSCSKPRVDHFSVLNSHCTSPVYSRCPAMGPGLPRLGNWRHDLGTLRNSKVTLSHAPNTDQPALVGCCVYRACPACTQTSPICSNWGKTGKKYLISQKLHN